MRRDRARRWTVVAVLAALGAALLAILAGCGGGGGDSTAGSDVPGCREVSAPEPKQVSLPAPEQTVKKGQKLIAVVHTSCGIFDISLATGRAPKTVNSFVYLARKGFYEGLDFYKAVSGFAVYGGDPQGDGSGGPGYSVVEPPPPDTRYGKGVVAMARAARSSSPPAPKRGCRPTSPCSAKSPGPSGPSPGSTSSPPPTRKPRGPC
jgi:Cyclophilin type peptidyl-prolyl cis-trans isomerase/CLD